MQRQEICDIQSKHRTQLDELKAKIKALTEKRNSEIESVLTLQQKQKLAELRAATKNRSLERSKKTKKSGEG